MSPPPSTPPDCVSLVSSNNTDSSSLYATKPVVLEQQRRYVHSGIGGAGNYHRVESRSQAIGFIKVSLSRCKKTFTTGIGGAGNRHDSTEAAILSTGEPAVARNQSYHTERNSSGVYRFGIGGSGNQASRRDRIKSSASSSSFVSPPAIASSSSAAPMHETTEPVRYSDQPLPIGAADRLAAKLFGIRKQGKSMPKTMTTGRRLDVREDIPLTERPHTSGTDGREWVNG